MRTRTAPAGFAGVVPDAAEEGRRLRPGAGESSVETLPGVGPKVAERLARLGIHTLRDLAEHLPRTYLDWDEVAGFGDLAAGEEGTVRCTLERVRVRPTRRRNLRLVEGVVVDAAGTRETAIWFNQAHLAKLPAGTELLLHGTRELAGGFRVARTEIGGAGLHTVGLVPEYPASEEVPSYRLRALVEAALPRLRALGDPLPASLRAEEGLPLRRDALAAAHRPRTRGEAEQARERLALEELLVLQVGVLRRRREHEATGAPPLGEDGELVQRYRALLPFTLTEEQEQAIGEIGRDLARERPMQRLLQGDVGSGKTVVALYALLRAVEAGQQGALMAPTETLAEQHFLTIEGICTELGVRCELLTSSLPAGQRRAARERLASGEADLAVGTHALIQAEVEFRSLAVAVVDEQHRFGVEQRRALSRPWPAEAPAGRSPAPPSPDAADGTRASGLGRPGTGPSGLAPPATSQDRERGPRAGVPHVLHMTATPIPRTLAQTVYGDLDVTEIARPPAERRPVVTRWVGHERSAEAYTRLRRHLEEGRQAYVVCPLVSESEAVEARAAEQEAERLREAELRGLRVGCLHGRLPPAERRAVMDAFKRRALDVLVATTVIEVGVDVPNATIMIVQEADRFGLAQLHQLRGRVGRGAEQSYCLLVSRPREELTEEAARRLEALVETTDGFRLAEVDLALRGEGQLRGTRQSGWSDLKFARLTRDRELIARARAWAERLVDEDGPACGPLLRELERLDEDRRGFA